MTLCSHQIESLLTCSLHARFTMQQLAPQFPEYNWQYKFLGGTSQTPRDYTAIWIGNGTGCNALLGPGFSSLALAISPVVNVPWLDWSATSTQLSDNVSNPTFSRVIPTDAIGAHMIVAVVTNLGWRSISILCVEGAYGNSVAAGLSDALAQVGGNVEISRCVSATATVTEVNMAVDQLLKANTRVIALAMNSNAVAFPLFKARLFALGVQNDVTLLFSESFCSKNVPDFYLFPGSFCATYAVNATLSDPFEAQFASRDFTTDYNDLLALGYNSSNQNFTSYNVFSAFAHDAVQQMMTALVTYPNSSSRNIFAHLRSITTNGFTGKVQLSGNDRITASGIVHSVQADGTTARIGQILSGNFTPSSLLLSQGVLVRGSYYSLGSVPSELRRLPSMSTTESAPAVSTNTLVAVLLLIVVVALIGFLGNRLRHSKRFKALMRSGLPLVGLRVLILAGALVLYCSSVFTVVSSNSANIGFVGAYIAITAVGGCVTIVEATTLVRYFLLQASAKDELPDEVVTEWTDFIGLMSAVSLGLKDLPQISLSFAAVVQESQTTFVVILALCVSSIFFGSKIASVLELIQLWIAKFLKKPERRFFHFQQVVKFIVLSIRLRGIGKFTFDQVDTLPSDCGAYEIQLYRDGLKARQPKRYRELKRIVQRFALDLKSVSHISQAEYVGLVRADLNKRFIQSEIPRDNTEGSMTMTMSTAGNPFDQSRRDARPAGNRKPSLNKGKVAQPIVLEDVEDW